MKRILIAGLFLVSAIFSVAETVLPAPARHFTDNAGVVSKEVAAQLDGKLSALEKSDSTQFYVVIQPKLDIESSLEDYTQRTAQAWKVGQKDKNNGLILFLFVDDGAGRKAIRYEIGYGLEGVFTDAQSKLIIEKEIIPALKVNNWSAAVNAGVESAIKSIKGEHVVTKETTSWGFKMWVVAIIIGIWFIFLCIAPSATLSVTGDILNIILLVATAGKGGSSGGGGSFGGGGSSGRT